MSDGQRLRPVVLGVGAVDGYAAAGLTNPRDAVLAGEVPWAGPPLDDAEVGCDDAPVLEMRIHGVGGAPPEVNLQSPSVVQVAGDGTAGFYRAWFPGGRAEGRPLREAYCWGGLNTKSSLRALYLLLVAFMLVNVAYWALPPGDPAVRRGLRAGRRVALSAGAARKGDREPLGRFSRGVVRLLGLALTVEFFATALTILCDLLAWQAPQRRTGGSSSGALPSWLGWYAACHPETRLMIALLVTLALLGLLMATSIVTARAYEAKDVESHADQDDRWPLTHRRFWRGGARAVSRQRNVHVIGVAGLIILYAALPGLAPHALWWAYVVVATACGVIAVGLTLIAWTERNLAHTEENGSDVAVRWVARAAVLLAIAGCVARQWRPVRHVSGVFPHNACVQLIMVNAVFAIAAVLAVVVATQWGWRRCRGLIGGGYASPLLATLAACIATIFGTSLALAVANVLGTPQPMTSGRKITGRVLFMPQTVYAGSLAMLFALVLAVIIGAAMWLRSVRDARSLARDDRADVSRSVSYAYAEQGAQEPGSTGTTATRAAALRATSSGALRDVATAWAQARATDRIGVALTALVIPVPLLLLTDMWILWTGHGWAWLQTLSKVGGVIGVAATVAFLAIVRSALTHSASRRRFGFFWDVGTFWPRACHPFAPPSYAERAVPEAMVRLRRIVGDLRRDPVDPAAAEEDAERTWMFGAADTVPVERACRVVLTGYSQGAPISVAVLAQLPTEVTDRMALLTLNAPVRRLYGQTFPAYYGDDQRDVLRERLAHAGDGPERVIRWINMVRYTDYIGGWMFDPHPPRTNLADGTRVDQPVMDPPVLWAAGDTSPPPTHRHSAVFADPQLRAATVELVGRLR